MDKKAGWISICLRRIGNGNVLNGYTRNQFQKDGCNSLGHENAVESGNIRHFLPNTFEGHSVISIWV